MTNRHAPASNRPSSASVVLAFLVCTALTAGLARAETGAVRVATLVPLVEEALAPASGAVEIVAAVRHSPRAPARSDVIDLGNPHRPNLEMLAQARADVVVGDALLHTPQRDALARFGAEVVLLDTGSVDGTFDGLVALARRVGAEDVVAPRVAAARSRLEALALAEPIPVLPLFGTPGSFLVVTSEGWIGSLLAALHFENLGDVAEASQRLPGYVDVSLEHVATMRPELVLLVAHGDPARIEHALRERLDGGAWQGVGHAATRGVHVLPIELFAANPGLRLPDAAEALLALAGAGAAGNAVGAVQPVGSAR